jgi:PAS domain S-box-containing protein
MKRSSAEASPVPAAPSGWRRRLAGRAPVLLALLILLLSVIVTVVLWKDVRLQADRDMQDEFLFVARQHAGRIEERMATYEQVARGTQAFLLGRIDVPQDDFAQYVAGLRLEEKYPGIQGLAIARLIAPEALDAHVQAMRRARFPDYAIRPSGQRPLYSPITHIYPYRGMNLRAPGFDMYAEPVRHEAMVRARDTGRAAASGKVTLIQEGRGGTQPGLVMYLPVYARGKPVDTVEQRRAAIVGWVGAPFRLNDLMEGLGGERAGDLLVTIYDGGEATPEARMFDTPAGRHAPRFAVRRSIAVAGRTWLLDLRSSPSFEARFNLVRADLIALTGTGIGVLLALLVWVLASGRKRALALAQGMTAQLRASEFRWKYALEGAGDGVWDLNLETGEVLYSKRWKEMLGYAEHEIQNDTAEFARLVHPDDRARALALGDAFLDGVTEAYMCEFRMRARDGSWRWILARAMAVSRDAHGRALRTVGTHTDITAAKENEQALRASNERLAAEQRRVQVILDNSHDAFVAVDAEGAITDWNAQAERLFGWTRAEVLGRDLAGLITPAGDGQGPLAARLHQGELARLQNVTEFEARRRDGGAVPVEVALATFQAESGHAVSAFIRDISERRRAQADEAERKRALDEARAALHHGQKLEAVGKLTGGVAHDFNNVLQIIAGSIQLLRHLFGGQPQADRRLDAMQSAVDRGAKLSSQLLAFARRQPLRPAVVDMLRIVRNMDDLLQRALGATVRLRTEAGDGLWNVQVDPGQLENVILNLAINARDAMPDGGELTLALHNRGIGDPARPADLANIDFVQLAVADTGIGMNAAVLEQAFEPFFTTKPAGEGTGLGLSMAYGFVKQSGGHIRIASTVGAGTVVSIYLPRSAEPETAVAAPDEEAVVGGSETVLVVEDDADVRDSVVGMLEELGYRVLTAHDGESAMGVVRSGAQIDLLFSDVVMPGALSAPKLAQAVREARPGVAVLFTSGYTRNALVSGGRLEEGVQLLSKPYRRDELARRVRQLLAMRPRQA